MVERSESHSTLLKLYHIHEITVSDLASTPCPRQQESQPKR